LEVLAGVGGCVAGFAGFAPFLLFGGRLRKSFAEKGTVAFRSALLVPLFSFVVMAAALLVCGLLIPEHLLMFAVPCVVVFLVATSVYVMRLVRR
jgi:hypothetical protein